MLTSESGLGEVVAYHRFMVGIKKLLDKMHYY